MAKRNLSKDALLEEMAALRTRLADMTESRDLNKRSADAWYARYTESLAPDPFGAILDIVVPFLLGALALTATAAAVAAPFYFFGPLHTAYGVLAIAGAFVSWKLGAALLDL
jgi:hypothetical protein